MRFYRLAAAMTMTEIVTALACSQLFQNHSRNTGVSPVLVILDQNYSNLLASSYGS